MRISTPKLIWIGEDCTFDEKLLVAVADPGFPVGGGGADLRCGHFSVKTNAKTKEFDPAGGGGAGSAQGSGNGLY